GAAARVARAGAAPRDGRRRRDARRHDPGRLRRQPALRGRQPGPARVRPRGGLRPRPRQAAAAPRVRRRRAPLPRRAARPARAVLRLQGARRPRRRGLAGAGSVDARAPPELLPARAQGGADRLQAGRRAAPERRAPVGRRVGRPRMIEVAELGRLFADYAWGIDHGRWELLAGTFAENASFGVSVAGEEVVPPIAGRAAIVDFISSTTIAQPDQRRHVITNVRPEGDG